MDRLFRDWRFALVWVIGISALAAAFFAECGGHEDMLAQPQAAGPAASSPALASPAPIATPTKPADERTLQFGEPVMDTTPFEPSPVEPEDAASAAATEASPQATATP